MYYEKYLSNKKGNINAHCIPTLQKMRMMMMNKKTTKYRGGVKKKAHKYNNYNKNVDFYDVGIYKIHIYIYRYKKK